MPGFILYNRRWSLGSDDFLLPGILLATLHAVWLSVITILLSTSSLDNKEDCQVRYWEQLVGYLCLYSASFILELCIVYIATRGTVFDDRPRAGMQYLIYMKQVMWLLESCWVVLGVYWLASNYPKHLCSLPFSYKNVLVGLVVSNLVSLGIFVLVTWCSWDYAGRSWLKMKKYQEKALQSSSKHKESRYSGMHRRSGGASRNWRTRKVRREYESSWDHRCKVLLCCTRKDNKSKTSFAEIAQLLSEFFRDLDVVPTDILVGLLLLRKRQQAARQKTISQPTNNVYDFLSGVKVTPDTKFVALNNPQELDKLRETVHYMYFALAAYGWPMYLLHNKTVPVPSAAWRLFSSLRCGCVSCCNHKSDMNSTILEDNCCMCNYSALKQVCKLDSTEIVYATFHSDVGETPFFLGVDFDKATIVISIRGTLSMQDIMTDLNAESEILPLNPVNEEWKGHKGMVQAAEYIYRKLKAEALLEKAFNWRPEAGTNNFPLVCVGHSLGGGTAAILAILLRQEYPNITCFAYSPPGGLLSEAAMLSSKRFMTSVVVGKDVVPRLGLHQMETLRHDLMANLKQSKHSKWDTLSKSLICTRGEPEYSDQETVDLSPTTAINIHPLDSTINLSVHQPLFPPGNIIHIVRHHPKDKKYGGSEPVYQAVWADNRDFDQVLISKCMIQDHMPDSVLDALEKACCVHAWHTVYTSRAICGPTSQPQNGSHVHPVHVGPEHVQPVHVGTEHVQPTHVGPEHVQTALTTQPCRSSSPYNSCEFQVRQKHEEKFKLKSTAAIGSRTGDMNCTEGRQSQSHQVQKEVPNLSRPHATSTKSDAEHVESAAEHVESAAEHVESAAEHVESAAEHVESAAEHVESAANEFDERSTKICDKMIKSTTYLETNFDASKRLCKSISNNNSSFQELVTQQNQSTLSSRLIEGIDLQRHQYSTSMMELCDPNNLFNNQYYSEHRTVNFLSRSQTFRNSESIRKEVTSGEVYQSYKEIKVENKKNGAHDFKNGDEEEKKNGANDNKDGVQSMRLLRTPSDIFSFYDISREGATTV